MTKLKRLNILKEIVSNAIKQAKAGAAAPNIGTGRNFMTSVMFAKNTVRNKSSEEAVVKIISSVTERSKYPSLNNRPFQG